MKNSVLISSIFAALLCATGHTVSLKKLKDRFCPQHNCTNQLPKGLYPAQHFLDAARLHAIAGYNRPLSTDAEIYEAFNCHFSPALLNAVQASIGGLEEGKSIVKQLEKFILENKLLEACKRHKLEQEKNRKSLMDRRPRAKTAPTLVAHETTTQPFEQAKALWQDALEQIWPHISPWREADDCEVILIKERLVAIETNLLIAMQLFIQAFEDGHQPALDEAFRTYDLLQKIQTYKSEHYFDFWPCEGLDRLYKTLKAHKRTRPPARLTISFPSDNLPNGDNPDATPY